MKPLQGVGVSGRWGHREVFSLDLFYMLCIRIDGWHKSLGTPITAIKEFINEFARGN